MFCCVLNNIYLYDLKNVYDYIFCETGANTFAAMLMKNYLTPTP